MSRVAVRAALVLPVAGHEELGVRVAVRAALFLPVAGHEELGVCVTVRAACLPAGHTHRRLGPESFGNNLNLYRMNLLVNISTIKA